MGIHGTRGSFGFLIHSLVSFLLSFSSLKIQDDLACHAKGQKSLGR